MPTVQIATARPYFFTVLALRSLGDLHHVLCHMKLSRLNLVYSVITSRMLNKKALPLPIPEEAASLLKSWGIYRVVCGCMNLGNEPTVFTTQGIEVIYAINNLN